MSACSIDPKDRTFKIRGRGTRVTAVSYLPLSYLHVRGHSQACVRCGTRCLAGRGEPCRSFPEVPGKYRCFSESQEKSLEKLVEQEKGLQLSCKN